MDTCVCCGAVIPEGRMVCWACENGKGVSPERTNDMKETMNPLYAVLATGAPGRRGSSWYNRAALHAA